MSHTGQPIRVHDTLGRPLRSLRVSVTDRCNIRCQYCMPEREYVWLPRKNILTFEEIGRLVGVFTDIGVDKIRLTGGEPLLRHELDKLVRLLSANPAVRDLALTTNGILLSDYARALRDAGLHRVTVSLDTLRPDRFEALTRSKSLHSVLQGIEAARAAGLRALKIDSVVLRGTNDDELLHLIDFGRRVGAEVRFIEYMDVAGATRWSMERVFSKQEMLETIQRQCGPAEPILEERWAPAQRYALPDGTVFGIVSSTTDPFCRTCDRSRLTADGQWYLCLYARTGIDLRAPLRSGATDPDLLALIENRWAARSDRGAESRKEMTERAALASVDELKRDPHREMHTRGG